MAPPRRAIASSAKFVSRPLLYMYKLSSPLGARGAWLAGRDLGE